MIERESTRQGKVPIRTIISAIVMLAGIVLMGYGYFREDQVFFIIGAALTVSGAMMQAILAIVPASQERWKGRSVKRHRPISRVKP
jgi:drug/metabolite transporter (DMT)-like permease